MPTLAFTKELREYAKSTGDTMIGLVVDRKFNPKKNERGKMTVTMTIDEKAYKSLHRWFLATVRRQNREANNGRTS